MRFGHTRREGILDRRLFGAGSLRQLPRNLFMYNPSPGQIVFFPSFVRNESMRKMVELYISYEMLQIETNNGVE